VGSEKTTAGLLPFWADRRPGDIVYRVSMRDVGNVRSPSNYVVTQARVVEIDTGPVLAVREFAVGIVRRLGGGNTMRGCWQDWGVLFPAAGQDDGWRSTVREALAYFRAQVADARRKADEALGLADEVWRAEEGLS
jgi:hypothetical protein